MPSGRTHPVLLALVVIVVTGGIAGALYAIFAVPHQDNSDTSLRAAGFNTPVQHRLDAKFTDSGGNLVADPPADASQLIDPPTLRFAFIEEKDAGKQKAAWDSFMKYLSQATGKPVEYQMILGEQDLLKAMHDGKLDVAGFNSGSVPTAVNSCGFVPVCAIPTGNGTALTRTDIIVPANSTLQTAADLRGHELTLTEPNSNSGYKAPLVLLHADFGLLPIDLSVRCSGSHEASIVGIASGKYQAAAVADDMLKRAISAADITPSQYRIIYTSETFPSAGLGYVYNLKPDLAAKIKDALLSYDWQGTPLQDLFRGARQTKFMPVNYKNDWSLIRRIDDEMGISEKIQ